jgi:hypothetical protein
MNELLDELNKTTTNTNRLKRYCKKFPSVFELHGLRIKLWCALLNLKIDCPIEINKPDFPCKEQPVLEADIGRTRTDFEKFRNVKWRNSLKNILQLFCINRNVRYKQGMNEV